MTEYENKPTKQGWKAWLKPLAIVGMVAAFGWYFAQGEPDYPEVQAGGSVYELKLTPL